MNYAGGTIGAHGCLTLHAVLSIARHGPLIAACPSFARNFHRGGGKRGRGLAHTPGWVAMS